MRGAAAFSFNLTPDGEISVNKYDPMYQEPTKTRPAIRWEGADRYVKWIEPQGVGVINARAATCVSLWLRSREEESSYVRGDVSTHDHACCSGQYVSCIECHRIRRSVEPSTTPVVVSFIEFVELDVRGKSQHVEHGRGCYFRELPFRRKMWIAFSDVMARVYADRVYAEKSFSSMPAHLRKLLRFGPLPERRELSEKERVFDVVSENEKYSPLNDIDKSFDDLLSEVTAKA